MKSAADESIPVFRPSLGEEDLEAVREVFESGWLGPGPRVERFERDFSDAVGAAHAIAVSSGTAALHLTCRALGLGPRDEVLVPALTLVSTAHAPAYCGAGIVFVDVEAETGNLDPRDLVRKITPASRAVVAVHYGGVPARLEELAHIARRNGLWLIEDAAHACGASYRDRPIGDTHWSDACCFSFNALKVLTTGDGGMITTRNGALARRLRRLRWMGIDRGTFQRWQGAPPRYEWRYRVEELGYKYTMNDLTAALGQVQLRKLPEIHARRRRLARRYRDALGLLQWLELPQEPSGTRSAWHLFPVRSPHRDALQEHLRERGISSSVHYLPLHLQPCYRRQQANVRLPVSERLGERLLSLPFHHGLSDAQSDRVLQATVEFAPEQVRV